jgi:hypothetical protein
MSGKTRDAITKLAITVHRDPTATAREKQLARAWLLSVHGKLPQ